MIDPVELCVKIFESCSPNLPQMSPFLLRMYPLNLTCFHRADEIIKLANEILPKYFANLDPKTTTVLCFFCLFFCFFFFFKKIKTLRKIASTNLHNTHKQKFRNLFRKNAKKKKNRTTYKKINKQIKKYGIEYKSRGAGKLKRDEVIKGVAETVPPVFSVNLNDPTVTILVQGWQVKAML